MASINHLKDEKEIIIHVHTNECGYVKEDNRFYFTPPKSLIKEYRKLDEENNYLCGILKVHLTSGITGNAVMFKIIHWCIGKDKYYPYESIAEFEPLEIYKNSSHIRSLKFTMVLVE